MEKACIYAEFDSFYASYRPLTPYGKLARAALPFYDSAEALNREYGLTERFIAFIRKSRFQADRLEFHLKNMPVIPAEHSQALSAAEILVFRQFLANAKAAFAILPLEIRKPLEIGWRSEELLKALNPGGSASLDNSFAGPRPFEALAKKGGTGETFHVADAYAPELTAVREKLAAAGTELARIRDEKIKAISKTYGLDFSKREFLEVEEARARKMYGAPDLFFEPCDAARVIVKPVFGSAYLELTAANEKLHAEELAAGQKVLKELTAQIKKEKNHIADYLEAVEWTDVLLAKARLALEYGMIRPKLRKFPAPPLLKKARFIPLEARLKALKLRYTPLTFKFSRRVNIIHGSNMGGKTVALKTLAFMQLLAQTGFFVPAEAYETCVYKKIHLVGDEETGRVSGLSGFGLEMNAFTAAYADTDRPCLILMDEFAKTTNSDGAAALLSAINEDFCANDKVIAFMATHFSRLAPQKNAAFLNMKGFDNAAFNAYFSGKTPMALTEKLKMLNKFMAYEITANSGPAIDAIKIARILGVSGRIVERAQRLMAGAAGEPKPAIKKLRGLEGLKVGGLEAGSKPTGQAGKE